MRKYTDRVFLVNEDWSSITTITKDGSREPTKREVFYCSRVCLYGIKGIGLRIKRLISILKIWFAAPLKESHASWENDGEVNPTPLTSEKDTE